MHPRRSESASKAPEKGFQASVLMFIPLQFKYWIGKSRAALAKHPNANQPLWEWEINVALDKGKEKPAPCTNKHHFASPLKKSSPFGLNLAPATEERVRGYKKRREKTAPGGRRVLVFPSLVSSYASSQRPPGLLVCRAQPGCSPCIPPGCKASTAALINSANLPLFQGPERAA